MIKSRKVYHSNMSFMDMLFNTLLMFIVFFMISFVLIQPNKEDTNIKTNAEFVVTLTWTNTEKTGQDDVDIYIQDPTGNLLFYQTKQVGLMHLDRDDLGSQNDVFTLPDGTTCSYDFNQEIVTIRGFIPGEWIINIHMFAKRSTNSANVEVKVDRLNPSLKTIFYNKYTMHKYWEEITVVRFTMSSTGEVSNVNSLPKSLVPNSVGRFGGGGGY